ncbi:aromatic-ring-hydroxylating dioxygenase subunit beta [Mycobacterium avium]|jgi:3-phenylpropionate/cinnamic acid dioxygenase small subunit|uniref:aromatic-ring-hydroxylating dioxygenase subunit beta n=1 Tax=Mycobacterium avium TaxID=1764 RepID=UPI0007A00531|nr:aromatic-ring-hydroxylating dioxygenase subunit beta [Mycobacterium avium]MDV3290066.1 aromatic-ring-hydroxylating dioxygenase subunit beta [Mycobacterium avium subsp. hominissuis]MDV3300220.1 aromatic-ring-hydroxylating dioxygenase subunit beta [Mycobacterium avium]PBA16097.1 ring-hydroxylating dioxygenase subunit beta [Mycobacterium avium]PBA91106.1 ring-hydroxylating dioxygenase subunit beta [Mycobacterium avium]PBJ52071.1 ring-hydroxylating dioxygenase subunit beta [Mycobacterium avium 
MTVNSETQARPALRPIPDPEILSFLYLEARLADEGRYSEWEALWADDDDTVEYRVPMHPDDDPRTALAYINDNRRRIKSRVAQLNTGNRHSQTPPSVMRRVISNSEVVHNSPDTVTVESNFALFEYRLRQRFWAGRVTHVIRRSPDGLRLIRKIVHLIDAGGPVETLAFLI